MSVSTRALVHPVVDFMLVGGLSLITLAVLWIMTDVYNVNMSGAPMWAYTAAFFVNYPHFAFSYQLFYENFAKRIKDTNEHFISKARMIIAGVLVPIIMLVYFVWVFRGYREDFLGYAVLAMQFFVGWHYVKQGYGVLITHSVYKGIFYSKWQKRILYGNAYVVWIFAVVNMAWFFNLLANQKSLMHQAYYDVPYKIPAFPASWHLPLMALMLVTTIMALSVLVKAWVKEKKGISATGVMGYLSTLYIWVLVPYIHGAFFFFIPLFHSLQYLPFVYKFKKSELESADNTANSTPQKKWIALGAFLLAGVFLGGLFMDWGPKWLDKNHAPWVFGFSDNAFLVSFLIFINIHHYFIDSAFWRRDNAKAQQYLFKA